MSVPRGPAGQRQKGRATDCLIIHPVLEKAYVASEHPEGQLEWLGDAVGMDFIVIRFLDGWARMHRGKGTRNEDWFGWRAKVLAPVDGLVLSATEPNGVNVPGSRGQGTAGGLVLNRADGVHVALGHVREVAVAEGEHVRAGQVVGRVGNNGMSWAPHLHVGAWRGDQPLQIRVDLAELGRIMREQGEAAYYGLPPEFTSTSS